MERHSYVSCIKINGVPILPPMMNNGVREEMKYYKQLAVAVEEKLKLLHISKQSNNDGYMQNIKTNCKDIVKQKMCTSAMNESLTSDIESITYDDASFDVTIPMHVTEHNFIENSSKKEINGINVDCTETALQNVKIYFNDKSNDENQDQIKAQIRTDSTASISDSVTVSTDLMQYMNDTISNKSNTTDTTPETYKPQVPKTLDIMPITLDELSKENYKNTSMIDLSNDNSSTPKLIRQGSYILDTPSPMLLAHIQTELADQTYVPAGEYVPTPSTTMRRREWNISQAKAEWKNHIKNKELIITDRPLVLNGIKCKRQCSLESPKKCNSLCSQTKCDTHYGICRTTRSVDCIQTMLAKEYICNASNKTILCNHRHNISDNVRIIQSEHVKTDKKISMENLSNNLEDSLGSGNETEIQCYEYKETRHNIEKPVKKHLHENIYKSCKVEDSVNKLKSTITPEKVITVLREIEAMHKTQMTELMIRQHKEQSLLQKEFEKQQLHLVKEIKKSFPDVSLPLLTESLTSKLCSTLDSFDKRIIAQEMSALQQVNKLNSSLNEQADNNTHFVKKSTDNLCFLDCTSPNFNMCHIATPIKHSQSTETSQIEAAIIGDSTEALVKNSSQQEPTSVTNVEVYNLNNDKQSKCFNVSRQLFPLDTKTVHVPIFDNIFHTQKHVEAATVINAYARGFLVRRIMKTECVINLKNTYKEALHCMLKLHVDAPLKLPELDFLHRLQLQCDAASMNIVELFAQTPAKRMQIIGHDREIKRSHAERPTSARTYSFATQRTLARKKLKEMGDYQQPIFTRSISTRARCQTWTSDIREKLISPNILHQNIKRSTSAGTVRKPWR